MTATSTFTYHFSRIIKRNHHMILCGFSRFYGSISSNEDEHPKRNERGYEDEHPKRNERGVIA